MPAKKNRLSPEIQEELAELVEANQHAYIWAEKAIEFRKLGLTKRADAAEKRAKTYLKRAMAVEARHPKPMRPDVD